MLDNIHLIVGYIQRLENKFIVNIVIGVLEFTQLNIEAVRDLIKHEKSKKDGGKNPVYASYSTFFGLGDETTNPGIRVKINRVVVTAEVKDYVFIRPTTASGFDAVAAGDGVDSNNSQEAHGDSVHMQQPAGYHPHQGQPPFQPPVVVRLTITV